LEGIALETSKGFLEKNYFKYKTLLRDGIG